MKHPQWTEAVSLLKSVLEKTEMEHTIKWGIDTYTINGKNVCGIAPFSKHVALWFYQGALLSDPLQVLINAQEGKTQAMRQWRFSSLESIVPEKVLAYVLEAIAHEKAGNKVVFEKKEGFELPDILKARLEENADLREKFHALSSYKQKEYAEYIAEPKREQTKLDRMEKIKPLILHGQGLNDKYKK